MSSNTGVAVAEPGSTSWPDRIEPHLEQHRSHDTRHAPLGRASSTSLRHPTQVCLSMMVEHLLDLFSQCAMDSPLPMVFERLALDVGEGELLGETLDVVCFDRSECVVVGHSPNSARRKLAQAIVQVHPEVRWHGFEIRRQRSRHATIMPGGSAAVDRR
jgi:hypothetical protein